MMLHLRRDSAKAEHQGWGGDDGKRELQAEVEGETDAVTEAKEGDEAKPAAETNGEAKAEETAPAAPAEEEDNSLTYEEYLKQKKSAPIAGVSQIQARKANEGSDDSQWKDGVVHTKEQPTEFFTLEQQRVCRLPSPKHNTEMLVLTTPIHYPQAEKTRKEKARKEKQLLEVEFTAPARQERSGDRGRGSRGGRGRGEGRGRGDARGAGRGRGAPRGGRGGNAAAGGAKIDVDDDKAFPSLA